MERTDNSWMNEVIDEAAEEESSQADENLQADENPFAGVENFQSEVLEPTFDALEENGPIPPTSFLDQMEEALQSLDHLSVKAFKEQCRYWNREFEALEPFDAAAFRHEMGQIDASIPSDEIYDFDALAEAYARITAYRVRLSHMYSIAVAHMETYKLAQNNLGEMAMALTESKVKDTLKKAQSALITASLTRKIGAANSVVKTIINWQETIQVASYSLSNLLKERENMTRINQNYLNRGNANSYGKTGIPSARGLHLSRPDEEENED